MHSSSGCGEKSSTVGAPGAGRGFLFAAVHDQRQALATVAEERAFEMRFPPHGERRPFPGVVAAVAYKIVDMVVGLRVAEEHQVEVEQGYALNNIAASFLREDLERLPIFEQGPQ